MIVRSFAPVAGPDAALLILGSMPGKASLAAGEYYAHPRNLFWNLMGELLGAGPNMSYCDRLERLKQHRIALWDVIAQCERDSALDSDIVEASIVVNDFASFFAQHPRIQHVYFNGALAEQAFRKHVLPRLPRELHLSMLRLPSTSPANAAISKAEKLAAWHQILPA